MRIDIAALSDVGKKKSNNEDYYAYCLEDTPNLRLFKEGALMCVADGLGGHLGGEIASKLAVSIVKDVLKEELREPAGDARDLEEKDEGPLPQLRAAIEKANASIYKTNEDLVKGHRPMGTTVVAAVIAPKKAYICNVGDSRAYLIRDNTILSVTSDHSWLDEQVRLGKMTREAADADKRRNLITRSVGTHAEVEPDAYRWHIVPGDLLLLCTDGLTTMVTDEEILDETRKPGTAADMVKRLVDQANAHGGRDNVTVMIARISPSSLEMARLKMRSFLRRNAKNIVVMFALLAYGALCGAAGYFLRPVIAGH